MSLRKIKLSTKLYVGFGLLLVILLGVSLLSWKELDNASVGFQDYRGLARDTNLTGRLQANMLMVRMNVKDFIITGSEKDHQEYAEYLKKMNGFLENSLREIKAPKRAANIQEMARIVKDYEKGFELVVKEQGERDRLVNSVLNLRGPEMERLLSKLMENARQENNAELIYQAGETLRSLLLARLYVMKFLDTNQQAAVDRVNKEFKSFQEGLARIEAQAANADQKELAQGVRKIDGEYLKAFGQVVEAIYDRNKIVKNTLDKIGPQVAGLVEDVKLSIKAEQDELGPPPAGRQRAGRDPDPDHRSGRPSGWRVDGLGPYPQHYSAHPERDSGAFRGRRPGGLGRGPGGQRRPVPGRRRGPAGLFPGGNLRFYGGDGLHDPQQF